MVYAVSVNLFRCARENLITALLPKMLHSGSGVVYALQVFV